MTEKKCCGCGVVKSVKQFYRKGKNSRRHLCISCYSADNRKRNTPEKKRAYYVQNAESIKEKAAARYWRDPAEARSSLKERQQSLRNTFLTMYGCKCAYCGETEREFLSLDHVGDNGAEERREHNGDMTWAYRDAISLGFPNLEKYQILCHECNQYSRLVRKPLNELGKSQRCARRLVDTVIDGYGSACSCCGKTNRSVLQLDHVAGGGSRHVKEKGPYAHYRDARDRNFPPDYRLLCPNCNRSAHFGGGVCIHKRKENPQSVETEGVLFRTPHHLETSCEVRCTWNPVSALPKTSSSLA